MTQYFNINLEFNHARFHSVIQNTILENGKGYVCFVDANVLTIAQKNMKYRSLINNSLINSCDGSSIALLANWIYKKKLKPLNGPEVFKLYIEKPYRHLLLGSSDKIIEKVRNELKERGKINLLLKSYPLPYCSVEEFDYNTIAENINKFKPDMIWVSLGAPKQEKFMNRLLPLINQGIMLGIGAAFNFYIGDLKIPGIKIGGLRLIWLHRLIKEPIKLTKRLLSYIIVLPQLYCHEKEHAKSLSRIKQI